MHAPNGLDEARRSLLAPRGQPVLSTLPTRRNLEAGSASKKREDQAEDDGRYPG
jgi:hypothetical protein